MSDDTKIDVNLLLLKRRQFVQFAALAVGALTTACGEMQPGRDGGIDASVDDVPTTMLPDAGLLPSQQ